MFESLVGIVAVLALVLLRMPIAFAMGIVGMAGLTYETNFTAAISLVSRLLIDTSQDYGLSVVPLFILMGLFVNKGGISRTLYQVSNAFLVQFFAGAFGEWPRSPHAAALPPFGNSSLVHPPPPFPRWLDAGNRSRAIPPMNCPRPPSPRRRLRWAS